MISKLNILLVDDDPVFHFINTKILHRLGQTQINTALNGKEALKFIGERVSDQQAIPDAIFVDLDMPVLNGFDFIRAFEKLNIPSASRPHIAILTSSSNSDDMEQARKLGVDHYLTKPLTEDSLRSVLGTLLSA
jgi:CheY-like chemotaxis protein